MSNVDSKPVIKTKITELFGIEHPIICGPMYWLAGPKLCAAISNAGALGNLTSLAFGNAEGLRSAIVETRKLTSKPFSVNVSMFPSFRFGEKEFDEIFKVCIEEQVSVIDVSGKPASKYMDAIKKAGIKIIHKVGSVEHAKNIERFGYDAVECASFEAGGHPLPDNVSGIVLIPRFTETIKIPVIATGGVGDGRGLAAALMLGAEGVMMASRFMATTECPLHQHIKDALVNASETATTVFGNSINLQGRGLKNAAMVEVEALEKQNAGLEKIGPVIASDRYVKCIESGDVDGAIFMVGQSIGLIHDICSCEVLIERTVTEARKTIAASYAKCS